MKKKRKSTGDLSLSRKTGKRINFQTKTVSYLRRYPATDDAYSVETFFFSLFKEHTDLFFFIKHIYFFKKKLFVFY